LILLVPVAGVEPATY